MLEFADINKSLPNGQNMGGLTQEIYFGFHADVLTWPTAPVAKATLAAAAIFGRTHTCYYQTKVSSAIPTQDEAAEKQKKSGTKKSKKETAGAEDDLPV